MTAGVTGVLPTSSTLNARDAEMFAKLFASVEEFYTAVLEARTIAKGKK
jgi:hypothetical protein